METKNQSLLEQKISHRNKTKHQIAAKYANGSEKTEIAKLIGRRHEMPEELDISANDSEKLAEIMIEYPQETYERNNQPKTNTTKA